MQAFPEHFGWNLAISPNSSGLIESMEVFIDSPKIVFIQWDYSSCGLLMGSSLRTSFLYMWSPAFGPCCRSLPPRDLVWQVRLETIGLHHQHAESHSKLHCFANVLLDFNSIPASSSIVNIILLPSFLLWFCLSQSARYLAVEPEIRALIS